MNIHILMDKLSIGLGSLFVPRYFREGIASPPLDDHLEAVDIEVPGVIAEGERKMEAQTLAGVLDAFFRVARWEGGGRPTMIYHHGASETPFDFSFNRIFRPGKGEGGSNLILIRAPFHRNMRDFRAGMACLHNFMAMVAVSVRVIESLIAALREDGDHRIVVSGTSLGGYIANIHHIRYDSADRYAPLLAGLAMYDTFFYSIYSRVVAREALENRDRLRGMLDFAADFSALDHGNVYPLLGRFDQLVRYEVQKESYGDCPVEVFNRGHVTGAISTGRLRSHIFQAAGIERP